CPAAHRGSRPENPGAREHAPDAPGSGSPLPRRSSAGGAHPRRFGGRGRIGGSRGMTAATERTTDPVCGMTVDPARAAAKLDYNGETYYFCNPRCLERFKANPESFLKPQVKPSALPPTATVPQGTRYICPMDPEIEQDHPGA